MFYIVIWENWEIVKTPCVQNLINNGYLEYGTHAAVVKNDAELHSRSISVDIKRFQRQSEKASQTRYDNWKLPKHTKQDSLLFTYTCLLMCRKTPRTTVIYNNGYR